ncbi:MAG: SMP-30/gluconolactonase/LRE family protein [Bryobacteraceae bacterium]
MRIKASCLVASLFAFSAAAQQLPIEPKLEKLGEVGAGEGPAWLAGEGLLFSGQGRIGLWKNGKAHVYRDPAGRPNGLMIDPQGRLVVCESGERRLTRTEKDGRITILADRFEGMRFNTPNDLTIDSKGRVYFSDPRYGKREGMEMRDSHGNTVEGVYRIDAPGVVHRVLGREVERANGVLVSPNDEFLYVADNNNNNAGGARRLWRYKLRSDGSVDAASRKLVFDWGDARGPDGVKMDRQGRLFVAAGLNKANPPYETAERFRGGIYVLSPDGKLLQFLPVPNDEVTNCAFGDDDLRSLYVTAGGTLFRARLHSPGWLAGRPR